MKNSQHDLIWPWVVFIALLLAYGWHFVGRLLHEKTTNPFQDC